VRRREFISFLIGVGTWPRMALAQRRDLIRRLGVLIALADSDPVADAYIAAFREGLQKLGWTEGRNVRIDIRRATLDSGAIPHLASELVNLSPDLVLSHSTPTTAALL
jgi:ABC-type uncharacterized transport system substrate-binding protein